VTPYDWTPCPAIELWAVRVKLRALVRRHEGKQGWIPCRLIVKAAGL
jgi:hypothetical protein